MPGTYSLAARSPDEMVAVDLLLGRLPGETPPDVIVAIVDASNLDRHLYLVTQLLELGRPIVVALNMIDVAARQGITVNAPLLSEQLGIPVVPIQANAGRGLADLQAAINAAVDAKPAMGPTFPEPFEREVDALERDCSETSDAIEPIRVRRLLLDVGGAGEQRSLAADRDATRRRARAAGQGRLRGAGRRSPHALRLDSLTDGRLRFATRPAARHLDRSTRSDSHAPTLGHADLPRPDVPRLSVDLHLGPAADEGGRLGKDWLADGLRETLPAGPFTSLLADGVVEGIGSVATFLPQILILFGFIAVLEDCGYMARAAFLMDKLMARCGLSGKSFIPLLVVGGLRRAGHHGDARHRESPRSAGDDPRRAADDLLGPAAGLRLLIGAFLTVGRPWWMPGVVMFGLYAIGLVLAPLVALLLKRTLLRGETPVFVMEMPMYKWPSIRTVMPAHDRRRYDLRPPGRHDHPGQQRFDLGALVRSLVGQQRRALRGPHRGGGEQ